MIRLTVLVEGRYDAVWVDTLLHRAFPRNDLHITTMACGGKRSVLKMFLERNALPAPMLFENSILVAVIDADAPSLADAREMLASNPIFSQVSDRIFFAVPTTESWLFADIEVAKKFLVRQDTAALDRIKFPEEIPLPKHFAMQVFGGRQGLETAGRMIMANISIDRAVSRSPSMREFLAGIARLLGENRFEGIPDAEKLLGRRTLSALVTETNPSTRIIYKTMSGERLSAEQLAYEITSGTPVAKQYAADLLRVARELLAQDAEPTDVPEE